MPSNNNKAKAVYSFLIEAEKQRRTFTLEDIATVSGWSLRTVRTYRSKKLFEKVKNERADEA